VNDLCFTPENFIFVQILIMKETIHNIKEILSEFYESSEIESFISLIFKQVFGYSKKDLILNADQILPESGVKQIAEIISRLKNQEPIQYILGETEFYGLTFIIRTGVLIPRFETEELVDLIIKRKQNYPVKILDIGTGSGCIAISLKKLLPKSDVWCCDISDRALKITHENAALNKVAISIEKYDILGRNLFPESGFDLIVSNPPYVTFKEKSAMQDNVLNYEPTLALFVPDDNPLLFYKAIVLQAKQLLNSGGELYFEINEAFGNKVSELLDKNGFAVEILKDINGKDRFAFARQSDLIKN
jgi:release factor glutamine methyltransferase